MLTIDFNLYISCFTSDFDIMRIKWGLKKSGGELSDVQKIRFDTQTGSILNYSWKNNKIVSETIQGCPFGMYTHKGLLYVCDAKHNMVVVYNAITLNPIKTIRSKMFNDIHSIIRYEDNLLITSTGVDSLIALSLTDDSTRPVISFIKDDNQLGIKVNHHMFDTDRDYSTEHINTESQLTHMNYAAPLSDGRIGISLFHQGKIIAYNPISDSVDVIVDNLVRSHSFFEYGSKLFIADSGNHCVKIYRKDSYNLIDTVHYKGWVQDIKHIKISQYEIMTVCDADYGIVYIYDLENFELLRTIQLDSKYRLSSCELKPD